jgi:flagellar biosynthesis protein FliP
MNFKLVNKNNTGGAILLLLIIVLSQARFFNFLLDTSFGRLFLILFILCISFCHKILGVVGVLFIIIMFNNHFYYEGFKSKSNNSKSDTSTTDDTTTTDASSNINISISKDQLKQMIQKQISDASNNNTDTSTKGKSSEGFDILGLENNIKRGKQSNSIPVNQLSRNANDISPFEGSTFLGKFSLF